MVLHNVDRLNPDLDLAKLDREMLYHRRHPKDIHVWRVRQGSFAMRLESRNTKFSSHFSSLTELLIIVTSFASSRALCADIQDFLLPEYFSVYVLSIS